MRVPINRPGVFFGELPASNRGIVGVPTSVAAFVGRTLRGPVNDPVLVEDVGEFEHRFGGLWHDSPLSYSVHQFFQNGGSQALIVRVEKHAVSAEFSLAAGEGVMTVGGLRAERRAALE